MKKGVQRPPRNKVSVKSLAEEYCSEKTKPIIFKYAILNFCSVAWNLHSFKYPYKKTMNETILRRIR